MVWAEHLFDVLDELEQEAEALYGAERLVEIEDRARSEYADVPLAGRLMAAAGGAVRLEVRALGAVVGELERVARDWVVVRGSRQDWLVPLAAVMTAEVPTDRAVPEVAWSPLTRLGLGSALRRLSEEGERCLVHLLDGTRHEGVPRRVGRDFVEFAEADAARVVLIALTSVVAVQSPDD
ncbi:hypothetical protein [Nocardioides acrostichi]|uniref:Uncharacterized protein n=1 Tax=Nocardioides acrostichi TaxID=2784339 RepID=A0A930UVZ6_9ACTN|nr:hypothetical protein [Nocardioides acrostichi]MBF4161878.1 hypothetical protein [Nocardioides acrostichi]